MKCFQPLSILTLMTLGGVGIQLSADFAHAGGAMVYTPGGAYGATVHTPPQYPAWGANVYAPPLYPAQGATVYSPPLYPASGAMVYSPPMYG
ncbi:MAG: hypothetical protein KDA84_29270, partial [Planctomycetaceae bacterium]|nr:hypothetical protein [Planctomycetaceae bacterium]